ncbi:MAG: Brp/Blh family beta-carotene 15,15'-dioxygenase [Planctomycetota bacterium]
MRPASWYFTWHARHTLVASAATLTLMATIALLPPLTLAQQLLVLAAFVCVTALPHGAVDHLAGRTVFGRWGRAWPAVFGGVYLALLALTVAVWLAAPPLALTLFLLLSALHFGYGDLRPERGGFVEAALRGSIPVFGPILFWPAATAQLFGWLLPGTEPASVLAVTRTIASATPFALLAWAGLALYQYRFARKDGFEIIALVLLVLALPPLLSFGIYFCGWHSFRHGLECAAELDRRGPRRGWLAYARHAAPLTLATIGLGAAAYLLLSDARLDPVAMTRVVFIGLAALTVPHVVIHALCARRLA